MDALGESADPPYLVPSHLREPQSIGPIPVRMFFVLLGVELLLGVPLATVAHHALGESGWWFAALPALLAAPFALPWLDPPTEHGAVQVLAHLARLVARRTTLGVPQQPDLAGICLEHGAVWLPSGRRSEP